MIELSSAQRRSLRARAHALDPVVSIGAHGLTQAVVKEIDVALNAHELIKIRVHDEDRAAREQLLVRVCEELAAAPVQHLGKILIVYRPKPEPAARARRRRASNEQRKARAKKARTGVSRALGAARSDETSPRATPALAPQAPRRRRRVVVMASTQSVGARSAPSVRRRRKNS